MEIIGILFGLVFTIFPLRNIYYLVASYFWQKTKGVIIKSFVQKNIDSDGNFHSFEVEYVYEINNVKYYSKKINACGDSWHLFNSAFKYQNKYQLKTQVEVYVNPKNPKKAFLERRISIPNLLALACGIAILIDQIKNIIIRYNLL